MVWRLLRFLRSFPSGEHDGLNQDVPWARRSQGRQLLGSDHLVDKLVTDAG